jgi:hypothetical protein
MLIGYPPLTSPNSAGFRRLDGWVAADHTRMEVAPMHRESDTHGPRQDDNLKHELDGMLHANRPSRAEEWREPELPPDEDHRWEDTRPQG